MVIRMYGSPFIYTFPHIWNTIYVPVCTRRETFLLTSHQSKRNTYVSITVQSNPLSSNCFLHVRLTLLFYYEFSYRWLHGYYLSRCCLPKFRRFINCLIIRLPFFSQILKCCCPDSILQVLYFNPPISFYTTFRYIIIHLAQLFGWTARFNLIRLYIGAIFIFI